MCLAIVLSYMHRTTWLSLLAKIVSYASNLLSTSVYIGSISEFCIRYSFHLAILRMFVSTAICVEYVFITYMGYIDRTVLTTQKAIGVILAVLFIMKVMLSVRPIRLVFNPESIMEVFSLASLVMSKRTDWLNFSFLQAYIVLSRYFQIEPTLEHVFNVKTSPFQRQLTRLTLEFVVFIYVFACGLQLFERLGEPWANLTATTFELTIANSFYFTVVTIFTVGYGDFVPYTLMGRIWIIFIIVFGAYLVSRKIGQVIDVVSDLRRGLGSFVKAEGVDHCVICGNVKWEYLKSFVLEFYGDERNRAKKLVVICDQRNWNEENWNKFFTAYAQFRNNVTYLEGSCVSRDDLIRAQVETALAVFILNNQHNPDPYAEDSETLKRILTIRSYTPGIPIYSMCALRDSMLQITYALEHIDEAEAGEEGTSRRTSVGTGLNTFAAQLPRRPSHEALGAGQGIRGDISPTNFRDYSEDDDDDGDGLFVASYDGSSDLKSEAICMQEVEMSLLAENVFCNGLSTLLANLILRVNPVSKASDEPWAIEYKIGAECRFEYVKLPMKLHNKKFSDIALIMYDYGVLLIATKGFMENKWRAITPDTVIHLSTIGLIVTFHSSNFLEIIMQHIATRVEELFRESVSERSSRDVSSPEDEYPVHRDVPRHTLAGGYLTGDLSVMYDDIPTDEIPIQQPRLASSFSSIPENLPLHESLLDAGSQESSPEAALLSEARIQTPPVPGPAQPVIVGKINERASKFIHTRFGSSAEQSAVPASQAREASQPAGPIKESHSFRDKLRRAAARGSQAATIDTSDDFDSDGHSSHSKSTNARLRTFPDAEQEFSVKDLARVIEEEVESIPRGELILPFAQTDELFEGPENAEEEPDPPTADESQGLRQRKVQHRVTFPNQQDKVSKKADPDSARGRKVDPDSSEDEERPFIFHGDVELPMKMKGHIVVCAIGKMALLNLKYFLQKVWMKRGQSKRTPVVAICPRLTEKEEDDIAGYASDRFFVIQGNTLSVKTLKRAQFEQAKAVVILACEDGNDVDHMDAKAIFTVMTLDYLLGMKSETFVCTMLDAEESMQLLRAPPHARRRGALLGRDGEEYLQYGISPSSAHGMSRGAIVGMINSQAASQRLVRARKGPRGNLEQRQAFGGRALSFGALSASGDIPRSMSFIGIKNSRYTDRREAIGRVVGIRDPSFYNETRRVPSSHSFRTYQGQRETDDDSIVDYPSMGGGASALNFLMNPSTLTMGGGRGQIGGEPLFGQTRGAGGVLTGNDRDDSFEKQRYASGEMMISSTYISLLIREYTMPGLMTIVKKIFGAGIGKNPRSKRCWVRTISIPQKWVLEGEGGKRTYREVFEALIRQGAVALGLYRSGDVLIRVQFGEDPDVSETNETPLFSEDSRYPRDGYSDRSGSFESDRFRSPAASDEEMRDFEIGGDAARRNVSSPRQSYEEAALLQNQPSYGTMRARRGAQSGHPASFDGEPGDGVSNDGVGERVNIPPSLLFDMAADVQAAQLNKDEEESSRVSEDEAFKTYTCPSSGRTAMFKEVPGGENVLPYVYTNPEAYTLVSEHDAVYVLVPPHVKLPEEW